MSEVLNISVNIGQDFSGDFPYAQASSGDALIMIFYNNNTSCTQIATENYSGEPGEIVIDEGIKYTCNFPAKKTFKLAKSNVTYKLFILNLELQEATLLYSGGVAITPDANAVEPDIWDGEYPVRLKTVGSLPDLNLYKAGDEVFVLGDGKYLHDGNKWEKRSGDGSVSFNSLTVEIRNQIDDAIIKNFVRYKSGDINNVLPFAPSTTYKQYYSCIKSIRVMNGSQNFLYKVGGYYKNNPTYGFYLEVSRKPKSGGSWIRCYGSRYDKSVAVNEVGVTKVTFSKDDNIYKANYDEYFELEIDYTLTPASNRESNPTEDPLFVLKDSCIIEAAEVSDIQYSQLSAEIKEDIYDGVTNNFVRYTAGSLDDLNLGLNMSKKCFYQKIKAIKIYGSNKNYLHKIDAYYNNHPTYGFYLAASRKPKSGGSWIRFYHAKYDKNIAVNESGVTKCIYDYDENFENTNFKIEIEIDYKDVYEENRINQTTEDPLFVLKDSCIVETSKMSGYPCDEIIVKKINPMLLEFYIKGSNPESNNYIKYQLKKTIESSINANSWGLHQGYEVVRAGDYDFSVTSIDRIINTGEWECAISISGEDDFMGNAAHGDELLSNERLLIDGVEKNISTIENFRCKELTFIQVSDLEKPSTSVPVCRHIKIYKINSSRIFLEQRLEWLSSELLHNAFLTMLPIDRHNGTVQITDKAFRDDNFVVDDVSTPGFTGGVNDPAPNNVKTISIWGNTSGISAEVSILEVSANLPNSKFYISNASIYNKLYYDYCGDYTTTVGEKWVVKTEYKITTRN